MQLAEYEKINSGFGAQFQNPSLWLSGDWLEQKHHWYYNLTIINSSGIICDSVPSHTDDYGSVDKEIQSDME